MKKLYTLCIAATVLFAACKKKGQSGGDAVNAADRTFAKVAGPLYLSQYEMGMLAFSNSSDSTIKKLAEKVLLTSNFAYNDLIQLSTLKSFNVPSYMDTARQNHVDALATMSGWAFDSAYLHLLVEDQHSLLSSYDVVEQTGNNMNLRTHAQLFSDTMLIYHEEADSLADLY